MLKNLFISSVLFLVLVGCDGPSVALFGPITFTQRHATAVYQPVDIPFYAMLMLSDDNRKTEFKRDSVVLSAFIPHGWVVQSVGIKVIPKRLDSLFAKLGNDSLMAYYDLLEKKSSKDSNEFRDSLLNSVFLSLLPKLDDAARAPEYDAFLTAVLDTGHTGRQFQSFKCALPIRIPVKKSSMDYTILGNIQVVPSAPGRFRAGVFMSLDNMSAWKTLQDTGKKADTVLTCFSDLDTIVVSGSGIALNSQNAGEAIPMFLSASPNPMDLQGGVISFLSTGKTAKVSLYDISGRPVFSEPVQGQGGIRKYLISKFTRRPLVAGQYILRLTADGKTLSRPITVLK